MILHSRELGYATQSDGPLAQVNGNLQFPSALQHFPDRRGSFPENRFSHPGPPAVPHGPGMLRRVAPHASHSFRDGTVSGYEEIPHYMSANPHQDMPLRIPTVDETLARMKLQGHSIMGAPNDLQTFVR